MVLQQCKEHVSIVLYTHVTPIL